MYIYIYLVYTVVGDYLNTMKTTFDFNVDLKELILCATNSDFLIPISLKPKVVNLCYFKLISFDLTELIV